VQRIANEIDAFFREGTDESKAKALALRPALDEAQAKHDQAVTLYESMQKANRPNDVAKNFVPVSTTSPTDAEGSQPTVIKRQEYDRMTLIDRARFIKSGGKLED
jgi:alcohol dehydrogenase class IV